MMNTQKYTTGWLKALAMIFVLGLVQTAAQAQPDSNPVLDNPQKVITVRTYPNPATNFIRISGAEHLQGNCEVKLFNMMGQEVLSQRMDLTESLDIEGLPSGTYGMTVDGDAFKLRSRVLVQ